MQTAREFLTEVAAKDVRGPNDDDIVNLEKRDLEIRADERAKVLQEAMDALGKTGYDKASDAYKRIRDLAKT